MEMKSSRLDRERSSNEEKGVVLRPTLRSAAERRRASSIPSKAQVITLLQSSSCCVDAPALEDDLC